MIILLKIRKVINIKNIRYLLLQKLDVKEFLIYFTHSFLFPAIFIKIKILILCWKTNKKFNLFFCYYLIIALIFLGFVKKF